MLLNRSGKCISLFFPDLSEKSFDFFPCSLIFAIGLLYIDFIEEMYCGGLNENDLHRLICLDTWYSVGRTV